MEPISAGTFELSGVSGVSLASGGDALGIRMGFPHPSLGLFDGNELVLSICDPPVGAPEARYVRYAWRVPVTAAGIRRFSTFPSLHINGPTVCDYAPGEAARVVLEWAFDGVTAVGPYSADARGIVNAAN